METFWGKLKKKLFLVGSKAFIPFQWINFVTFYSFDLFEFGFSKWYTHVLCAIWIKPSGIKYTFHSSDSI